MNKTRNKISLLVGLSVMATVLVVLLIFNIASGIRIKNKAHEAIDEVMSLNLEYILDESMQPEDIYTDETQTTYYAQIVYVIEGNDDPDYKITAKEQRIIDWYRSHPSEKMQFAKIGESSYYIDAVDLSDEYGEYLLIAYVNVSGEPEVIRTVNVTFIIVAILVGIIGSIIGYRLGLALERSQLAQKTFFENTSHELKTPLMTIRGYAEGLEKGVITDYKKTGLIINNQTERMSNLIEDILYISKLESGMMKLNKQTLVVEEYIQDILMPFEGAITSRGLELSLELGEGTINIDPDRFEHAISNLITNAIKYAVRSIEVAYIDGKLSVYNDCDSMTDDELKHIFDRFYTNKNGNTGIGLALTKEIIEMHDMKIDVIRDIDGIRFVIK